MNETKPASVLFRAYIRRKPSGLLLVTVLSTLLPRPVFRSYPLDIGEAAAVERSVGHALEVLSGNSVLNDLECHKHTGHTDGGCKTRSNDKLKNFPLAIHDYPLLPAVNVVTTEPLQSALPCGPEHEHSNADKREEQHAAQGNGEFKQLGGRKEFQHGSPHGLRQPREHAAVRSEEQEGAEGYAVKGGHLVTSGLSKTVEEVPSPHRSPKCMCRVTVDNKKSCVEEKHRAAENSDSNPYELKEQPTQHLRLRVVWQGLL